MHKQESVLEKKTHKFLLDFEIQTDNQESQTLWYAVPSISFQTFWGKAFKIIVDS